jgi:hypothetical protein
MTPEQFYDRLGRWFPRRVRAWLYGLGVAVMLALGTLGYVDGDTSQAIQGVMAAALLGVALGNVEKPPAP